MCFFSLFNRYSKMQGEFLKGVCLLNDCVEMVVSSFFLDFCFFFGRGKLSNLANLSLTLQWER